MDGFDEAQQIVADMAEAAWKVYQADKTYENEINYRALDRVNYRLKDATRNRVGTIINKITNAKMAVENC